MIPFGPDRLLPSADLPRPAGLLSVYSVIRDDTIRPGLPAAYDHCGAPAVRLARIVDGLSRKLGLVGTSITGAVGSCRVRRRGFVARVGAGAVGGCGPAEALVPGPWVCSGPVG